MIIPVLHRVIVKPDDVLEANDTFRKMREMGLEIPQSELLKREQAAVECGTVTAIGDTAFLDFNAVQIPIVGDRVIYAKYAGKLLDKDNLMLNDEDILGIIRGE